MSLNIFDLCPALILVFPAKSSDKEKLVWAPQVGAAVMANKPIFLVTTHGTKVSEKLARVTDRFFEMSVVNSIEEWEAELAKVRITIVHALREMGLIDNSCDCHTCMAARQLDAEQDDNA
jgi:hypothetical protein